MNPVTREQWTTALRSGEYTQARGKLYQRDCGYCCLGVLAALAGAKPVPGCPGLNLEGHDTPAAAYIPLELATMVGIGSLSLQFELASMNDGGHSFAEIADYIDKLPLKPRKSRT